jgi:hypothetical protein
MVRFTVYQHDNTNKINKLLADDSFIDTYPEYVEGLQASLSANTSDSYTPTNNIVCYSLDDSYGQAYHSPIFNLSKATLEEDIGTWLDENEEDVVRLNVPAVLKDIYRNSYVGSQKSVLNNFLLKEFSIMFMRMFDSEQKYSFFKQFFNPGLIAVSSNYVIYEIPPTFKLIEYYNMTRESIRDVSVANTEKIPLPWQVYVAVHDGKYNLIDTFMYFAHDSILKNGFQQPVYTPFLTNFYYNGLLCRPFYASYNDVSRYAKNIPGLIHSSYDAVWNSGWNFDLYDTLTENVASFLRNGDEFYRMLKEKGLGSVYENISHCFQRTESPVARFDALISNISKLSPEDMLFFPYATPADEKNMLSGYGQWLEEQYQTFIENSDLSDEERENTDYVDELFNEYLSGIEKPLYKKKPFQSVLNDSVLNYCERQYSQILVNESTSDKAFSFKDDTYSRLALYFRNNFYCK